MRLSCLVFLLILGWAAAVDFHVIPFDVDPVIRIDGELDDWAAVPNPLTMTDPAHATWGTDDYTGIDDLNGTIQLAWRPAGLFFAAVVVNDAFVQTYTGNAIYNGDHANLFIDLAPQDEPERNALGNGQYHLVISPGNLAEPGSGEILTDPEVYFYVPEGMPHGGQCEVAARRTQTGYIVEVFLPFSLLGSFKAQQGKDVNFTVALSDADAMPARQQTFVTPTTAAWQYGRGMMIPMVLGDGNGRGQSPVRSMPILAAPKFFRNRHTRFPSRSRCRAMRKRHTSSFAAALIPTGSAAGCPMPYGSSSTARRSPASASATGRRPRLRCVATPTSTSPTTKAIDVPRVVRDGKAYAEVRIPEGYATAIVRRPQ